MTDVQSILNERNSTHGDYGKHAWITQELKRVVRDYRINVSEGSGLTYLPYMSLTPTQRESVDMIFHKIARVLTGDPNFKDHWDDIAGYATLISNELENKND